MSKTFLLPNMIWQADAIEVEDVALQCALTEHVEFDLEHHLAMIEIAAPQAVEEILLRLAAAGYPASTIN